MSKHKVCQYQVAEGGNWSLSRWGVSKELVTLSNRTIAKDHMHVMS